MKRHFISYSFLPPLHVLLYSSFSFSFILHVSNNNISFFFIYLCLYHSIFISIVKQMLALQCTSKCMNTCNRIQENCAFCTFELQYKFICSLKISIPLSLSRLLLHKNLILQLIKRIFFFLSEAILCLFLLYKI